MRLLPFVFAYEKASLLKNKIIYLPIFLNIVYWLFVITQYEIQVIQYQSRAAVFYEYFLWILVIDLLLIGLLAVHHASRDQESGFAELVATYAVTNTEWLLSKWFVTQLYGLVLVIITVMIQGFWFLWASMSGKEWLTHLVYVLFQLGGSFFIVISLAFLFTVLVRPIFAYFLIPVIIILSMFAPFDYVGNAVKWDNPRLHLLAPIDYMFIDTPFEGIWGIDRVFKETLIHQGAVFCLSIFLLCIALLFFWQHRRKKCEKTSIMMLLIIIILPMTTLSVIRFQQYNQNYDTFIQEGENYIQIWDSTESEENGYYNEMLDDTTHDMAIEKNTLELTLQAERTISVQSELTIKNRSKIPVDEIYLTLHHDVALTSCQSTTEVNCDRDHDWINLQFVEAILPNETVDVMLDYTGKINVFHNEGNTEQAFITSNRIYFPKEVGWYPLIGKRPLAIAREHNNLYAGFELRNARLEEDYPTIFQVRVHGNSSELPLAMTIPNKGDNFFQGTSQYGLSLIGGNLTETAVGDIRMVVHPEIFVGATETVSRYQKVWLAVEEQLAIPLTPDVVYVLPVRQYYDFVRQVNNGFYVLPEEYQSDEEIVHNVLAELFMDSPFIENPDLTILKNAIEWFMLKQFRELADYTLWYERIGVTGEEYIASARFLGGYQEQGEDDFINVLTYLYQEYSAMENKSEFNIKTILSRYERVLEK